MSKRRPSPRPVQAARSPTPATPEAYGANSAGAPRGPQPPPRTPRRGRWRRWLLIGAGLLVLLRVALALALPSVLRSALHSAGLRGDYDSLSLSLLGGSVELSGLKLWPADGVAGADGADAANSAAGGASSEAPLQLDFVRVNVGLLTLLATHYVVEDLTLSGLHVRARRAADGSLQVAGLSLPSSAAPTETPPETPAERPSQSEPKPPPLIALEHLAVNDVTVAWTDETRAPPVATSLRLDLTGDNLQAGPGASDGSFELALAAAGECERLALLGTVRVDPAHFALDCRLELRGLHAGPLSRYLPPGTVDELHAGTIDAKITAGWTAAPQGGALQLELSGFDFHDSEGAPLLAFDALRCIAPRLDAEAGVFELSDLVLMGLRGRARMDAAGTLHALGFALGPPPAGAASPTSAAADATMSSVGASGTASSTTLSAARLPRLSLERLDLELAELTVTDEREAKAAPLVAGLRLQNREPLRLLDADPESLPPLRLLLTGRALPVAQQLRVEIEAAPWQSPATLIVGLDVSGLRGEGLTELHPALAATLDGSDLRDGRLTAELRAELELKRRGTQLDLSHGLEARLHLRDLALRDAPDGVVLAGLKGLELDAPRIDPAGGLVHLRALELDTPQVHVLRDAAGLHVAGLLLRIPAPAPAPADAMSDAPADASSTAASGTPTEAPAASTTNAAKAGDETAVATEGSAATAPSIAYAGPELRVDRLELHGLDATWRDETCAPPCAIDLNALEFELRRFTTQAFVEPKPIHFSLELGAGEVELPRREKSSSVFAGLATAAAHAVTGNEDERQTEHRPAFGEVALTGTVKLAPALTGNVRLNLAGFELLSLEGPAAAAGVQIGDGLLDTTVSMRLRGEQGSEIDTRLVFTDLSLSEPADGPIATYLKLPAPLDSVLFLLRNERGEHKLDFSLPVPQGGVGGGRVAAAAGQAIGEVIGRAVAAVPARMLTSVTDLVGVTGGDEGPPQPELALVFAPGSTELPEVPLKDLRNALTRMLSHGGSVLALEHHLGQADLARADQLGNPSPEQCSQRAAQLRQQRSELLRRQAECSAEARALLLVGRVNEAESARQRLIESEQQLCLTEAALDNVFERLRPGAERYREQRARVAALEIGQARLETVRRALLGLGLPAVDSRIELRPPRLEPIEGDGGGTVLATIKGG